VGKITLAERGQLVTAIVAINAIRQTVPLLMIFPRVHFKLHMLTCAPPGTFGRANPSGWTNEDLFLDFLHHFTSYTGASIENKVLLILDGHESHNSIRATKFMKEHGIVLVPC